MIQELSIKIKNGGLTHTISIDTGIEGNLTYDLSEAIIEVIRMASANPEMVVGHIINEYGLPERFKNNASEGIESIDLFEPHIVPKPNKKVLIIYNDDYKAPLIVNDIIDRTSWNQFIGVNKIKQWCYLNDALKEGYKL